MLFAPIRSPIKFHFDTALYLVSYPCQQPAFYHVFYPHNTKQKKKSWKKFKWNWVLLFSKITLLYCMRSMPVSHFECFRPRSSRLSFLGLWIFCFVWFINKFDLSWQLRPTVFEDIFKLKFDSISHPLPLLLIVVRPFIAPPKVHSYIGWRSNLESGLIFFLGSQVTVKTSTQSEELNVTCGIPQGTVLGLCLFSLYTSVMPEAVTSGNLYLYADDTTVRCIASTVD